MSDNFGFREAVLKDWGMHNIYRSRKGLVLLCFALLLVDGDDVRMLLMTWGLANNFANACGILPLDPKRNKSAYGMPGHTVVKFWKLELVSYIFSMRTWMSQLKILKPSRNTTREHIL